MDARSKLLGLAAIVSFAGACKLGPDYQRPSVPVPDGWRAVDTKEQASLANTPWWDLFQDPKLRQLIEIALAENKDLQIAAIRQALALHQVG